MPVTITPKPTGNGPPLTGSVARCTCDCLKPSVCRLATLCEVASSIVVAACSPDSAVCITELKLIAASLVPDRGAGKGPSQIYVTIALAAGCSRLGTLGCWADAIERAVGAKEQRLAANRGRSERLAE